MKKNDFDSNYNCANSFQAIMNFDDAIQYYQECTRIDKKDLSLIYKLETVLKYYENMKSL